MVKRITRCLNQEANQENRENEGERAFRELVDLHPELEDFLRHPETFSTEVARVNTGRRVENDLHRHEQVRYVPDTRRKFISPDTEVMRLTQEAYGWELPSFLAAGPRSVLAYDPRAVNVGLVLAGGSAPGTNVMPYGICRRHERSYGLTTGRITGFVYGFRGLGRKGDMNVTPLTTDLAETHLHKPGCWLGMSRHREDPRVMVDTLEEFRIDLLYVVGGDGTLEATHTIAKEVSRRGRPIAVVGIPKTIDNDIAWCWTTFGFETAVEEAAQAIRSFHSNVQTHGRIGIFILYGGHAGFTAANAAIASGVTDACLIPEEPVTLEAILAYTERLLARRSHPLDDHALFVVAEGVAWTESFRPHILRVLHRQHHIPEDGPAPDLDTLSPDAIRAALATVLMETFAERFGKDGRHIPVLAEPRALISSVAPSAQDIRTCLRLAYNAVDAALAGYTDVMSSAWLTEYVLVPLHLVAGRKKMLPVQGAFWSMVRSSTGQPVWPVPA